MRLSLSWLRFAAVVAVIAGAGGSLGLWIHAAQHPPLIIIALFVIWVLSPFALLGIGYANAQRWTFEAQKALYCVTLFIALATIVIYADDALNHRSAHRAFVYVIVPPVSWLLMVAAVTVGALRARKNRNRKFEGQESE
jgi:multisubunit Na+/H+ antiporter MnhG subunit